MLSLSFPSDVAAAAPEVRLSVLTRDDVDENARYLLWLFLKEEEDEARTTEEELNASSEEEARLRKEEAETNGKRKDWPEIEEKEESGIRKILQRGR